MFVYIGLHGRAFVKMVEFILNTFVDWSIHEELFFALQFKQSYRLIKPAKRYFAIKDCQSICK